ncbi:DUF1307 domain-containing protein [Escherichia coli]
MKAFNKLFSLVVASVLVFSLAGCGDKEESKKFSANLNGTEIDMEKVDFKALQGISGINVSAEDAKKGITMAQMELVMKAAGFKEVK